ncbi:MAG: ABC transporter ATP-binding protein [Solirubrobacteraceae bacterium]|nr:ABC transporter ATP-binding protein [Solirubrobacteraceae bacterium]
MTVAAPPLELRGVSLAPGDAPPVHGLSFTVGDGEIVALTGPSGSGKTTALRAIVRLGETTGGEILLSGAAIAGIEGPALRRRIGLVAQQPAMLGPTVADDLAAGAGAPVAERTARAALEEVGLSPALLARNSSVLSGGEQARVALARALLAEPDVLLLDEPSAALDAEATDRVANALRRRTAGGLAILLVTHDPHLLEATGARGHDFLSGMAG